MSNHATTVEDRAALLMTLMPGGSFTAISGLPPIAYARGIVEHTMGDWVMVRRMTTVEYASIARMDRMPIRQDEDELR